MRLARHAARAGSGQPRGATARALRLTPDSGRAARGGEDRAGPARADLSDARLPRARAAGSGRRLGRGEAGRLRARAEARPRRRVRRGCGVARRRVGSRARRRRPERSVSHLRLGARRQHPRALRPRGAPRRERDGAARDGRVPARRRPARVLVPPAAPGAPAGVRASPRRRPGPLAPRRNQPCAPNARDDPRRRHVQA